MNEETTNQHVPAKRANNTLIIGGVVVAVLVVIGGVILFSNKSPSPQSSSTTQAPAVTEPSTTGNQAAQSPSAPASSDVRSYTLDQVAKHATESDCWLAIDGKVYNVTEFIPRHPGGKSIVKGCGKDASILFNQRPTNNKGPHPAPALEQLKKLYIGELKP